MRAMPVMKDVSTPAPRSGAGTASFAPTLSTSRHGVDHQPGHLRPDGDDDDDGELGVLGLGGRTVCGGR